MRRYLHLLFIYYRSSLLSEMEYRTNLVASIGMSVVWIAWILGGVTIFFYHRDTLGGWTYNRVLVVLGLWNVFGGLLSVILVPNVQRMVEHIQKGTLDFVIIKPANSQFLATLTACSPLKSLDIVFGFGLIVAGLYREGYSPSAWDLAAFFLMLASGATMVYSLWLLLVTMAFWFVRVDNFTEIFATFLEAGRFPVSVYRGWLRFLLTFIVPIAFLTTFPAASLFGQLSPEYPAISVAIALVLVLISRRFWNYAIRFYSSASS